MPIWNDTASPLAYLITFRTYGTWLHGDERGATDRYHNTFGGPHIPPNSALRDQHLKKLKSEPFLMNTKQRTLVIAALKEVCIYRAWTLYVLNVRTNHAHIVVANNGALPESILRDFKAYSTRALKSAGEWKHSHSPWADSGSKRYLWTEASIVNASDYVQNGQGDDLPQEF